MIIDDMILRIVEDSKKNNFNFYYIEAYADCKYISIGGQNKAGKSVSIRVKITDTELIVENETLSNKYIPDIKIRHENYMFWKLVEYGHVIIGVYPQNDMAPFEYHHFSDVLDVMKLFADMVKGIFDRQNILCSTSSTVEHCVDNGEKKQVDSPCVTVNVYLKPIQPYNMFEWGPCLLTMRYYINNGFIEIKDSYKNNLNNLALHNVLHSDDCENVKTYHCLLDYDAIRKDLNERMASYYEYEHNKIKENIENF